MTAINMGIFSEIANNKADCDLRNIDTNKTDIIIEYQKPTAENNYTWYRLYATGWVEQGGKFSNMNTTSLTVNLPIIMANINYSLIGTGNIYNNTSGHFAPNSKTTASFTCGVGDDAGAGGFWRVDGCADMTGHEILPQASEGYVSPLELLQQVYPVGSVYMGTQSTCPLASLFGTWELVSNGKALWTGNGTNANTTIEAGLPNITGGFDTGDRRTHIGGTSGALYQTTVNPNQWSSMSSATGNTQGVGFDASKSNPIYGNSNTVQPPAYVVNVWRRTA